MEEVERRWGGGTYFYPAPTASGLQRLREGRLFGGGGERANQQICESANQQVCESARGRRLRGKCAVSGWNAAMVADRVDSSLESDITLWALCG